MNVIDKINAKYVKNDVPEFRVGDTVEFKVRASGNNLTYCFSS